MEALQSVLRPRVKRREVSKTRYHQQIQSPLLGKLPPELRVMVFQHILQADTAIPLVMSRLFASIIPEVGCHLGAVGREGMRFVEERCPLSLLRTCWRIYLETLPLLYGLNAFKTSDLAAIRHFAYVPGTWWLRSLRINAPSLGRPPGGYRTNLYRRSGKAYRRSENDPLMPKPVWAGFWKPIATFTALEWLTIYLDTGSGAAADDWAARESEILAPFQNIRQPHTKAVLILCWPRKAVTGRPAEEFLVDWEIRRLTKDYLLMRAVTASDLE